MAPLNWEMTQWAESGKTITGPCHEPWRPCQGRDVQYVLRASGCTVSLLRVLKLLEEEATERNINFYPCKWLFFFLTFSFQVSKSNDNIFFLTLFLDINYILTKLNDSVLDLNVTLVSWELCCHYSWNEGMRMRMCFSCIQSCPRPYFCSDIMLISTNLFLVSNQHRYADINYFSENFQVAMYLVS